MKISRVSGYLLIACLVLGLAGAEDSPIKLFRFPGASLWVNSSEFTVPEAGLILHEDLSVRADRVVLKGPLVTQGFGLTIEARELDFSKGGSIRAFVSAAQAGNAPSPLTSAAGRGTDADNSCEECTGGPGSNGKVGQNGARGKNGFTLKSRNAPNAGIVIAVSHIVGIPVIDGKGQQGGQGGKGEPGQDGGPGGKGSKRQDRWWPVEDIPPGAGGAGGAGGDGGAGGEGGTGGDAIPVVLYAPKNVWDVPGAVIRSEPGNGGEAGEGGDAGHGGMIGPGGDAGYGTEWLFFPEDTHSGGLGAFGATGKKGAAGVAGVSGQRLDASMRGNYPVKVDTQKAHRTAQLARQSWFEYHLIRSMDSMISMGLTLGADSGADLPTWSARLSLEQKLSVLKQQRVLRADSLKKVQTAWTLLFRDTIQKAFEKRPVPVLERSLGLANQATQLLASIVDEREEALQQASALQATIDQWMVETAQRAALSCQTWAKELTRLHKGHLASGILGRPNRLIGLWVPECKRLPEGTGDDLELASELDILSRPKDRRVLVSDLAFKPEVLIGSYSQYLTIDRQSDSTDPIRRLFDLTWNGVSLGNLAFAENQSPSLRVIILEGIMIEPEFVQRGAPHQEMSQDTEMGRLVGYLPAASGITSIKRFNNELISQAWLWETLQ